jgi:hypothetical protein
MDYPTRARIVFRGPLLYALAAQIHFFLRRGAPVAPVFKSNF